MRRTYLFRYVAGGLCAALLVLPGEFAGAQESASAPLVAQLTELMASAQLDAIASQDSADRYVAALVFPGQLLVVSARYEVPIYIEEKITNRQFREVYTDLNQASVAGTKIFVIDTGANGLRAQDDRVDMFDAGSGVLRLDGDWVGQQMLEADYRKAVAEADTQYARMLSVLIARAQ